MTSLKVREFKQSIINFVNGNELPDEVKRMVLSEILKEQEEKTVLTLRREIEERDFEERGDRQNAENVSEN